MPDDDQLPPPDGDDEPMLLSQDDLAAVFAAGAAGAADPADAPERPAKPPPPAPPAVAIPDSGNLDQSAIDALFSGTAVSMPAPAASPAPVAAHTAAPPRPRSRGHSQQVGDLDLLADVTLTLSAVIGRKVMTISEVLKLRPGSDVELDKLFGEPVELWISDRCVARGEVVVTEDKFGIRITELGGPH
jgi:flagellar motor switch protein FliN/FliY